MLVIDNHNSISFLRGCRVLTWLSELGSSAFKESIMASKICSKCKQNKLFSEFYKCHNNRTGYQSRCKDCKSRYLYVYDRTERGKRSQRERAKRYHKRHPEKIIAKHAVYSAVRAGLLPKAETFICSCGNQAEHYHHYKGYAKEHHLSVIPMCADCHKLLHKKSKVASENSRVEEINIII